MARQARLTVLVDILGVLRQVLTAGGIADAGQAVQKKTELLNGVLAAQIDRIWKSGIGSVKRSLVAAASESFDLFDFAGTDVGAGAGLDELGQAAGFAKVALIYVENEGPGELRVGGDGTAAAFATPFGGDSDLVKIPAGGQMLLVAPDLAAYAVADTTDHLLKFEAIGGDCAYGVFLAGRSA